MEELESDKEEISCNEVCLEDLSNGNGEVEKRDTLSPSNIPKPTHADPHLYASTTAVSNETLLSWLRSNKFNWFALYNDLTLNLRHCGTEVLNEIMLNFTEYLNNSTLTDEDKTLAEISRQAFFKYMENKPLSIDGEVISQSESETDEPGDESDSILLTERKKKQIQALRRAIKRKAKRVVVKEKVSRNLLKRELVALSVNTQT